jgi:solute carrier family 25 oxoglutarate transporter 11
MSMNVGMLACYDQAKEVVAKVLNDPMTNGPSLATQIGSSAIAVGDNRLYSSCLDGV